MNNVDLLVEKKLELNCLPRYSDWPKKLFGAESSTMYPKNSKEIYREYEVEKWSRLCEAVEHQGLGVDAADIMQFPAAKEIPVSLGDDLYLAPPLLARLKLASIVADRIHQLYRPGDAIIELGAGTGSVIIRLAKDRRFVDTSFHAGDLSPSGLRIINCLAKKEQISIHTGIYDFHSEEQEMFIPEGGILYTSFAIAFIQNIDAAFWRRLFATYRPRAVVVAEPIFQHFREETLLGLLRKRYCEANDYGRNILPSIQDAQREGVLTVQTIEENLIGINPLCPVSVITMSPSTLDE